MKQQSKKNNKSNNKSTIKTTFAHMLTVKNVRTYFQCSAKKRHLICNMKHENPRQLASFCIPCLYSGQMHQYYICIPTTHPFIDSRVSKHCISTDSTFFYSKYLGISRASFFVLGNIYCFFITFMLYENSFVLCCDLKNIECFNNINPESL